MDAHTPAPVRPAGGGRPSRRARAVTTARHWLRPVRRRDLGELRRLARRAVTPMERGYRRRFRMRLGDWMRYHQSEIVFDRCTWMGVPALKNPLDAWIYQEILHEVRPDVVVEIGSAAGGGTLYLAHLLDLLGNGQVVSVDLDRSSFAADHPRIVALTGRSDDPAIVGRVSELCEGKRTLVIHDADHRAEQVLADLELYAPLVSVGSYLIVEDGVVDLFRPNDGLGWWAAGPLAATERFVGAHPAFRVDPERERYLLTLNPKGYLQRVS